MSAADEDIGAYDVVWVNLDKKSLLGLVTDVGYDTDRYTYDVRTARGTLRGLSRNQITFSHRLESPFECGTEVVIFPHDPQYTNMTGKRGAVVGQSFNPETGEWGFAVQLGERDCWSFMADELVPAKEIEIAE